MASISSFTINVGLISIPVKLFSAVNDLQVHFNMLHNKCHNRVNQQYFCSTCGEVVPYAETDRGFEYEKGHFAVFTKSEIDDVAAESSKTLAVHQFVDVSEVDPAYFEKTYYLGPAEGGSHAFALLTSVMAQDNKAAIGSFVLRGKEHLVLIRSHNAGLVLHTLLYADELRENEFQVREEIPEKEMTLASSLIDQLTEPFDPSIFKDENRIAVEKMIQDKISGKPKTTAVPKAKAKALDLMDALVASVTAAKEAKKAKPAKNKKKAS